jgi:hypothetical protein
LVLPNNLEELMPLEEIWKIMMRISMTMEPRKKKMMTIKIHIISTNLFDIYDFNSVNNKANYVESYIETFTTSTPTFFIGVIKYKLTA